nr:hypothetical protein [Streptomyces sp. NRRL S-237]
MESDLPAVFVGGQAGLEEGIEAGGVEEGEIGQVDDDLARATGASAPVRAGEVRPQQLEVAGDPLGQDVRVVGRPSVSTQRSYTQSSEAASSVIVSWVRSSRSGASPASC